MAVPAQTRSRRLCYLRLGPVLEINNEDQMEDRVDEALQYYQEYHSDATVRTYLTLVTQTDVDNEYIPISSNVLTVSRLFPVIFQFIF